MLPLNTVKCFSCNLFSDNTSFIYTISSSNPNVHFVADQVPVAGMHGGFRGAAPVLFFRLSAGQLKRDDVVTITYGARSQGGNGLLMPTFSSDRMPFPLYVDFDGSGPLYSLPIQPIRVIGAAVHGVHGFAPSVVRPGERFTLSVRAQDRYYNRASGAVPAWPVSYTHLRAHETREDRGWRLLR